MDNSRLLLAIFVSCFLILFSCFHSVQAQIIDTPDNSSHAQNTLLPVKSATSGLNVPLSSSSSSSPSATYDEQLGITFTQSFTSLTYNVTALPQTDSDGYGPAYLLNGLSNDGYWYQVGLSYDWPYTNGGYSQGFRFFYEVFDSTGNSVYPVNGGGGLKYFSDAVHSGDLVLLNLYLNNSFVYMYARDWNTGATASETYQNSYTSSFIGLTSKSDSNGFFTGLMTEWYHVNPFTGDEAQVTYSDYGFGLSSAYMWMDEWNPSNLSWSGAWSSSQSNPANYNSNPTGLQSFSSHGATEYSSAYQFITGSNAQQMTSITLLPAGSSTPLNAINYFEVSYILNGMQQVAYAKNGTLTFTADNGTNVIIFGVSFGSTSTEKWVLNSQGTNTTIPAGATSTFYYYDLLSQEVAYIITGGGNPDPILTYYTAPSTSSSQFNQTANTNAIPQIVQQTIMVLRGTLACANPILGISQDQWATPTVSWNISQVNQIPSLIIYYHQYQVTARYSTSDGSIPSSRIKLSGTQYGSNYQQLLTITNQSTWLDANTPWSTSTTMIAASETERWTSSTVTSGNMIGAIIISLNYVHQYQIVPSADSNSVINPSNAVWVNAGSSYTFTYSANSWYIVNFVLVDGSSNPVTGSYTFDNVQENHLISVTGSLNPTIIAAIVIAAFIIAVSILLMRRKTINKP